MSARDRIVLMAIAAVAVLGAGWMLAVKPARQQASAVESEVAAARTQLTTVQGEITGAQSARQRYRSAYASLATLGIAVPTSSEVPALMYAIDQASNRKKVEFTSISNGGSGSGSSGASASAAAQPAALTQMPFSFTFNGDYKHLIRFLQQLEGFTVQSPTGTLQVSGRLLTVQSITFAAPASSAGSSSTAGSAGSSSSSGSSSGARPGEMTWTITATAYVLPAAPTPSAPAGGASGGAQPASSGAGAGASPAGTPAVVRATP